MIKITIESTKGEVPEQRIEADFIGGFALNNSDKSEVAEIRAFALGGSSTKTMLQSYASCISAFIRQRSKDKFSESLYAMMFAEYFNEFMHGENIVEERPVNSFNDK